MTNGEKFETAKERFEEFDKFCNNHTCDNCPVGKVGSLESDCAFHWLEYEDKKELEKCPFCGSTAIERKSNGLYYVSCINCSVKTVNSITQDGAIDAWNRRV